MILVLLGALVLILALIITNSLALVGSRLRSNRSKVISKVHLAHILPARV
jgi:hypothetical protein